MTQRRTFWWECWRRGALGAPRTGNPTLLRYSRNLNLPLTISNSSRNRALMTILLLLGGIDAVRRKGKFQREKNRNLFNTKKENSANWTLWTPVWDRGMRELVGMETRIVLLSRNWRWKGGNLLWKEGPFPVEKLWTARTNLPFGSYFYQMAGTIQLLTQNQVRNWIHDLWNFVFLVTNYLKI